MEKKRENMEISNACGGPCNWTIASVENYSNDVTILSVNKTQLNVQTGADIGAAQNVAPANMSRKLQRELRGYLREFTFELNDCSAGCYCDGSGGITYETREETFTLTFTLDELRVRGSSKKNVGDTNESATAEVESGQRILTDNNGRPVTFDPQRDEIGSIMVNCCAVPTFDIDINNRFRYEVKVKAKLKLAIQSGECKDLGIAPENGAVV